MGSAISGIRTPWRAVAAMFILNGTLFGMWASRVPAVADRHDLSPGNLGLLLLLLAGGAIVAFPLSGRLSDQKGAVWVTLRVAVAYVIAMILIAIAPSVWTLAVALFLFGATHGAMDVAMNTWAGEVERGIDRPVMSSFHAMFSLGAGLGAASGAVAASMAVGHGLHFITAALVIAALTFPVGWIRWISETQQKQSRPTLFAFPRGPLVLVGLIAFCASLGEGAMADWSAIFLVLITEATEARAAIGYTVFSVAMVAMRLAGDRVTLWLGPVLTARLAGLVATTGAVCAVGFGTYPMALIGFALMGLGYAVIMPLAFSRAANDADLLPGAAIAAVSTLGYGGLLLGPPVIGFLAEATSIRAAFTVLAILSIMMVLLARAVRPQS